MHAQQDFCWSPSAPVMAVYQVESAGGNLPARISLLHMPDRAELRQKNLFSVADVQMFWHPQGDYLAVQVHNKQLFSTNRIISKDIQSKAKQSKAKQSKAKQSKAKQSKANLVIKAKQSKPKQFKATAVSRGPSPVMTYPTWKLNATREAQDLELGAATVEPALPHELSHVLSSPGWCPCPLLRSLAAGQSCLSSAFPRADLIPT